MSKIKQSLDEWLDSVDYKELANGKYVPSQFALQFVSFIKLVNGSVGESNKTPPVHLKMLDKLVENSDHVANLIFRGAAKTSLFMEYLTLYLAVFHELPNFGPVDGMIYIADSMENGAKSARKNIEFRYENSDFLKANLLDAKFTDTYLEFTNTKGQKMGVKLFGATTGIRGTKIFGKRPVLCVLDDLMSDEASKSKTIMALIKDTVYKGVEHALDPTRRKVIFNGTPFNKEDILVEAVESGAWDVNVYPVCEKFPCTKEEFSGAWEDRFSYEYIANQYDLAKKTGRLDSFYQELMLRIISDDTKLVHPNEIRWYKKSVLLQSKSFYNFYITTDFATSAKQSADYSVISVWAINSNGDYFWVDGQCKRTTMNNTIDKLFELVSKYKPQSVGIEVTGQQGAFIQWLQKEMMQRNIFFSFASSGNNNAPGIRPVADKLSRFNLVVPMFKAGKFWFPEEDKDNPILKEGLQEINLATSDGLKGKDDFLDTISMLAYIKVWRPSESVPYINPENDTGLYDEDMLPKDDSTERMDSYIV